MPYNSTVWLEEEAAKARDRIESIETWGMRWRRINGQGRESDVTDMMLAEAKERLAEIEHRLGYKLGEDDR